MQGGQPPRIFNYLLCTLQSTQLFPVKLYGLGSTQCESVRSIILRLAAQHSVTYTVLINFLVPQHCALKVRYGGFPECFWCSLLLKSPLMQAVADATGQPELTQCKLRVLSEVIDCASCMSMLRGIVAVRVGGPFGVCANEQWLRRKYVSGLTEVAVKEAANNIPNLTLTELCLKVGLSRQALCKRFPQIGADAAAGFSRRRCSSAWCRLLSFARKLREARLHLEATGRAFNRPGIYKYAGLWIRSGSSADRLFRRVRERIESKVDRH